MAVSQHTLLEGIRTNTNNLPPDIGPLATTSSLSIVLGNAHADLPIGIVQTNAISIKGNSIDKKVNFFY